MDKYRLTPHKITICILINYYISGSINYHHKQSLSHLLIKHIKETDFKDLSSELSLYEFIDKELRQVLPLQFLNNEFLEMVQFDSIDDIYIFMSELKSLFQPSNDENGNSSNSNEIKNQPLLDIKSIFGTFIKKVLLNFNQILFDGLIKLFDQLNQYLNDFYNEAERRLKQQQQQQHKQQQHKQQKQQRQIEEYDDSDMNTSQNMDESIEEENIQEEYDEQEGREEEEQEEEYKLTKIKLKFLSPLDEEKFIYEETIRINSLIGKVEPKEIEYQINQLKQTLPNVKRVHLISLLSNIEYQDYESSLEDLHRYFDYVNGQMINHSNNNNSNNNNNNININGVGNSGSGNSNNNNSIDTTNIMLPYAVLNLVRLHYHFGNFEESYLALRETIRIAQERGDHSCLALADHWLARLLKKSIFNSMESKNLLQYLLVSHSDIEILKKSIDRAGNLEMPDLLALNHNAYSLFKLENGQLFQNNLNNKLNYNFNNLNNNSNNNNNNNNNTNNTNIWNNIFQPIEISKLLDKSPNNITLSNHLYSTIWELLGNSDLSQFFIELSMKTNLSNNLSLQRDPLRSITSNYQINNSGGANSNNSNEEPDLISFCKLALLLSNKLKFKESIQILLKCFSIYKNQYLCGNLLSFTTLSILFDYLINNQEYNSSGDGIGDNINNESRISTIIELLIQLINRFQSDDSKDGPGWYQIIIVYEKIIKYFIYKRGMYEKSYNLLMKAIKISKDFGIDNQTPILYTLLSKLFEFSSIPYRFSGLQDTLTSLSVSNHYHLQQSIAESNIALIKIHLNSDKLLLAKNLCKETLPLVVSNVKLNSELLILYAKCLLPTEPNESLDLLIKSEQLLDNNNSNNNSNNNNHHINTNNSNNFNNNDLLKEIYYLKSLIYNNLNDIENRNLNSKKFKLLLIQKQQQKQDIKENIEIPDKDIISPKIGLISPTLINPILKFR